MQRYVGRSALSYAAFGKGAGAVERMYGTNPCSVRGDQVTGGALGLALRTFPAQIRGRCPIDIPWDIPPDSFSHANPGRHFRLRSEFIR